jgi:uncharacterized protein YkwD
MNNTQQQTLGAILNKERIETTKKAAVELYKVSVLLNRYANDESFRQDREERFAEASGETMSYLDSLTHKARKAVEMIENIY